MDIPQEVVNWALGLTATLTGAGIGYVTNSLTHLRAEDKELANKVHDLAIIVAGMQQRQIDTDLFRAEVRDQLRHILERIDKLGASNG